VKGVKEFDVRVEGMKKSERRENRSLYIRDSHLTKQYPEP
jgi:hypothetical protein